MTEDPNPGDILFELSFMAQIVRAIRDRPIKEEEVRDLLGIVATLLEPGGPTFDEIKAHLLEIMPGFKSPAPPLEVWPNDPQNDAKFEGIKKVGLLDDL